MKKLQVRMILATLMACIAVTGVCVGQGDSSRISKIALSDMSFISGSWRTEWGGGLGEEHWSAALSDSMLGTFRFVKEGKARFYELMLIEQTSAGLVLRLKHFNSGLIGWEEKAQVYSYPLIDYRENMAVFEQENKRSRLTFQRMSKEALTVRLDQTVNEKSSSQEFKFKLLR